MFGRASGFTRVREYEHVGDLTDELDLDDFADGGDFDLFD
jgi:hypothetical protein